MASVLKILFKYPLNFTRQTFYRYGKLRASPHSDELDGDGYACVCLGACGYVCARKRQKMGELWGTITCTEGCYRWGLQSVLMRTPVAKIAVKAQRWAVPPFTINFHQFSPVPMRTTAISVFIHSLRDDDGMVHERPHILATVAYLDCHHLGGWELNFNISCDIMAPYKASWVLFNVSK